MRKASRQIRQNSNRSAKSRLISEIELRKCRKKLKLFFERSVFFYFHFKIIQLYADWENVESLPWVKLSFSTHCRSYQDGSNCQFDAAGILYFSSHSNFSSYFLVRTKQTAKKGVGREDAIQTNATFLRGGFLRCMKLFENNNYFEIKFWRTIIKSLWKTWILRSWKPSPRLSTQIGLRWRNI